MSRVPEPTDTPDGPEYEGRPLDRPTDDVVDQGAGFDIATLVTRRRVLSVVAPEPAHWHWPRVPRATTALPPR